LVTSHFLGFILGIFLFNYEFNESLAILYPTDNFTTSHDFLPILQFLDILIFFTITGVILCAIIYAYGKKIWNQRNNLESFGSLVNISLNNPSSQTNENRLVQDMIKNVQQEQNKIIPVGRWNKLKYHLNKFISISSIMMLLSICAFGLIVAFFINILVIERFDYGFGAPLENLLKIDAMRNTFSFLTSDILVSLILISLAIKFGSELFFHAPSIIGDLFKSLYGYLFARKFPLIFKRKNISSYYLILTLVMGNFFVFSTLFNNLSIYRENLAYIYYGGDLHIKISGTDNPNFQISIDSSEIEQILEEMSGIQSYSISSSASFEHVDETGNLKEYRIFFTNK